MLMLVSSGGIELPEMRLNKKIVKSTRYDSLSNASSTPKDIL